MEYKNILFEVEDDVAVITFNRPKVLNVINLETMLELNNVIHRCQEAESIKTVILTGGGDKAFVAGADVTKFKEQSPQQAIKFAELG